MSEHWKPAPGLAAKIPDFLIPEDEYRKNIGEPPEEAIRRLVYSDRAKIDYVLKDGPASLEEPFYVEFLEECKEQTALLQSALEEAFNRHNLPLSTHNKASAWKRISLFIRPPLFTSKSKGKEKAESRSRQRNNQIQSFIHLDPDGNYHFLRTNFQNVNQEWHLFMGLMGLYLQTIASEGGFVKPSWDDLAEGIATFLIGKTNLQKEVNHKVSTLKDLQERLLEPWYYLMPPREAIKRFIQSQLTQDIPVEEITESIIEALVKSKESFEKCISPQRIGSPKDESAYKLSREEIKAMQKLID